MTLYMLPAGIALVITLWVMLFSNNNRMGQGKLFSFVAILGIHHLTELALFSTMTQGLAGELILRTYYIATISVFVFGFFYIMNTEKFPVQKYLMLLIGGAGIALSLAFMVSDLMVVGATQIGYSITAIRGPAYSAFAVFSLFCMACWLVGLWSNYKSASSPREEVEHFYALLGMGMLAVMTTSIFALLYSDWNINATALAPIGSAIFMVYIIKGKNSYLLNKDIRRRIPFCMEWSLFRQIHLACAQYVFENISHKETLTIIERALVVYKLEKNQQNKNQTAKSMGVGQSTVYKKLETLRIPHKK